MGTEPLGVRGHARQGTWLFTARHGKVLEVGPAGQQHPMAWEQLEMRFLALLTSRLRICDPGELPLQTTNPRRPTEGTPSLCWCPD